MPDDQQATPRPRRRTRAPDLPPALAAYAASLRRTHPGTDLRALIAQQARRDAAVQWPTPDTLAPLCPDTPAQQLDRLIRERQAAAGWQHVVAWLQAPARARAATEAALEATLEHNAALPTDVRPRPRSNPRPTGQDRHSYRLAARKLQNTGLDVDAIAERLHHQPPPGLHVRYATKRNLLKFLRNELATD